MSTHNTAGVEYAKLSETKAGDILVADVAFTCMKPGPHVVNARADGTLYVDCTEGGHDIDGQADDGEHMIGFTRPVVKA